MFCFALLKVEASKSITEVDQELAKLVERLIDIVRSLQSPRHRPESEPDEEVSILAVVGSSGRRKDVPGDGARDSSLGPLGSNMNMFALEGCAKSQSFTLQTQITGSLECLR